MVFLGAWYNLVFFQKFIHRIRLPACGYVFHRLSDFRAVQGVLLDGEQSKTGRVLELAPEVFQKILEHAGIAVYFQKGVPVFLVCRNRLVPAVLVDFGYSLQQQFHLVENEDNVTQLVILGDLCFHGFVPYIFLCHNCDF